MALRMEWVNGSIFRRIVTFLFKAFWLPLLSVLIIHILTDVVLKVIGTKKESGGMYEVRFFGGFHQRAVVEKNHIKSITTNIHSLQVSAVHWQDHTRSYE